MEEKEIVIKDKEGTKIVKKEKIENISGVLEKDSKKIIING